MESYIFEYVNENEFRKYERSLKKYNMLAYKKMYFSYYPSLKEGKFLGTIINENKEEGTFSYELELPTDSMFARVHGTVKLYYTFYSKQKMVMLEKITPEGILGEGHQSELTTYKGVMVSKENYEKDMFKINLLKMIQK